MFIKEFPTGPLRSKCLFTKRNWHGQVLIEYSIQCSAQTALEPFEKLWSFEVSYCAFLSKGSLNSIHIENGKFYRELIQGVTDRIRAEWTR